MSFHWVVVNYAGRPVEASADEELATERVSQLNDNLSPWERAAGQYYGLAPVPQIQEKT